MKLMRAQVKPSAPREFLVIAADSTERSFSFFRAKEPGGACYPMVAQQLLRDTVDAFTRLLKFNKEQEKLSETDDVSVVESEKESMFLSTGLPWRSFQMGSCYPLVIEQMIKKFAKDTPEKSSEQ